MAYSAGIVKITPAAHDADDEIAPPSLRRCDAAWLVIRFRHNELSQQFRLPTLNIVTARHLHDTPAFVASSLRLGIKIVFLRWGFRRYGPDIQGWYIQLWL